MGLKNNEKETLALFHPIIHSLDPIMETPQIVKFNMGEKLHEERVTPNYQPHIRLIWG
jgi:hypothetical protein